MTGCGWCIVRPATWAMVMAAVGAAGAFGGGILAQTGLTVDGLWPDWAIAIGLSAVGAVFYWAIWPGSPVGQMLQFTTPFLAGAGAGVWLGEGGAADLWMGTSLLAVFVLVVAAVVADMFADGD